MTSKGIFITIVIVCSICFIAVLLTYPAIKVIFITFGYRIWTFLSYTLFAMDQWVLWLVPIAIFIILVLTRLFKTPEPVKVFEEDLRNFYENRFVSWKSNFKADTTYNKEKLKKELARLFVYRYAIQKGLPNNFRLFDDFKNKKILINESIQDFLFTEHVETPLNLKNLVYKLSGNETKDFTENIDKCLFFLEQYMELENE